MQGETRIQRQRRGAGPERWEDAEQSARASHTRRDAGTEGDRRTAGQDTHTQMWFAARSHNAPRTLRKKYILRAKSERGEAGASAACPRSPQDDALPSWTQGLGGSSVLRDQSWRGGKHLQAAQALPRKRFLRTFLVNSAAPSRVVFLPLW